CPLSGAFTPISKMESNHVRQNRSHRHGQRVLIAAVVDVVGYQWRLVEVSGPKAHPRLSKALHGSGPPARTAATMRSRQARTGRATAGTRQGGRGSPTGGYARC